MLYNVDSNIQVLKGNNSHTTLESDGKLARKPTKLKFDDVYFEGQTLFPGKMFETNLLKEDVCGKRVSKSVRWLC